MDANRERIDVCSLCLREASDVTHHHLIPKTTHKTKRFKKQHTVEAMHTTVPLCQPCHRACHQFFTEKELASSYYTVELLLSDEKMLNHVSWVKKQKPGLRMKKSHKGRAK